ncbi:hypothetical protein J2S74_002311 [Evansella vedderi]|uniref:Uncharacterized protein n=1 Tax=Evansella vedderi TaxID=38282 RepID=A0ABT9ZUN8_9BACI|nr:hypothetical protein [Evansella vedderi]MDQ0254929.1 hypothetical protein [Evansella vedderi]
MAPKKSAVQAADPKEVLLGEGAFYFNYDVEGEEVVGAVEGGAFNVAREFKNLQEYGAKGPIKGLTHIIEEIPRLTVNSMSIVNANRYAKFYAGLKADTSNAGYDEIKPTGKVSQDDYLKNVAFVGSTAEGKDVVIIVENALGDGELESALENQEKVVNEVQFTGHYDPTDLMTPPYKMRYPKATTQQSS